MNYIQYNKANNGSLITWNKYKDVAGSQPVDGASGTPSILFTRNNSPELRNIGDFLLTKGAGNLQGEGVSTDFIIEPEDKNSTLQIRSKIKINGDYFSNDIAIFIYDVDANTLIVPNFNSISSSQKEIETSFQTSSSSRYRFIVHVASTNSLSYTISFGEFFVGNIIATNKFKTIPIITSNITIDSWDIASFDSSGGSFTITLPSNPKNGDEILLIDVGGMSETNPVTIGRNGKNIDQIGDNVSFDDAGTTLHIVFNSELDSWLPLKY